MDNKNSYDEAEIEQLRQELRPMIAQIDPEHRRELLERIEVVLKKIGSEPPRLTLIKGGRYVEKAPKRTERSI